MMVGVSTHDSTTTGGLVDSVHPTLPRWVRDSGQRRLEPPTHVGRYRVGRKLGQGGGGTVYAGHDDELGREVAIKFVPCGAGSLVAARVLREARALARLSHPGIVHIYDYTRLDDTLTIVMELVTGQTLGEWLETSRPWSQQLALFMEIGRGLAAAHAAGVVHRDFKPSNVIVGADERPRILDFGLAQLSHEREQGTAQSPDDGDELVTRDGAIMGTPKFMSPEQWAGHDVDARTDQFSFCLCLFGAVYGAPPFATEELMVATATTPLTIVEPPRHGRIPRAVMRVLRRGLQVDPQQRWPSMDVLVDALHTAQHGRRRVAMTGLVVVAVASGVGFGVQREPADSRCQDAAQAAPRWNDDERSRVRAALRATERGHVEDLFSFADRRLDAYARAWAESAERLCLARTRNELTAAVHDSRRVCLQSHRRRFEQTVAVLRQVDATTLPGVTDVVRSLPRLGECDVPVLGSSLTDEQREAVQRADVLRTAARLDESEALLRPLSELGSPQVQRVQALIFEDRGEFKAAADALRQAYQAAESQGLDEQVAAIAVDLVRVLGYRMSRYEEAASFSLTAAAKVERVAPDYDGMRAELAATQGRLSLGRGELKEALGFLDEAVSIRQTLPGEELGLAADLNMRGQAQSMLGDQAGAEASLQRALQLRIAALGATHPLVGSNLLNLSHIADERDEIETARGYLESACDVLENSVGPHSAKTAGAYAALAGVLDQAGERAQAESYWRKALAAYDRQGDDKRAGSVRTSVALRLIARKQFEDAQRVATAAVDQLRRSVGEDHPAFARAEIALSNALREQGRFADALGWATHAAAVRSRVDGTNSEPAVRMREHQAFLLRELGRHDEVIALLGPYLESIPDERWAGFMGGSVENYVVSLAAVGRDKDALALAQRAAAGVKADDSPVVAKQLAALAEFHATR